MYYKKTWLLLLLVCMGCLLQAQTNKARFHSANSILLLNGSNRTSAALQTVNGFAYKQWFAGIGLGLDYYHYRSIPLFLDLKKEFGKGKNSFFLYGDIGYNFAWLTYNNKYQENDVWGVTNNPNYKGGMYYDGGAGYKVGFRNNNALLISAGFSQKKLSNEQTTTICGFVNCIPSKETYNYSFGRLALKVGWRF